MDAIPDDIVHRTVILDTALNLLMRSVDNEVSVTRDLFMDMIDDMVAHQRCHAALLTTDRSGKKLLVGYFIGLIVGGIVVWQVMR